MSQGHTAGLSISNDLENGRLENDLMSSIQDTEHTRENAYIQFHPEIGQGKNKLKMYWDDYHAIVTK